MYILIDGIDESPDARILSQLLIQLGVHCKWIKLLVICRPEREIESVFANRPRIEITEALISKDIEIHLKWSLQIDEQLKTMGTNTKEEIRKYLLEHQGGM